MATETVAMVGTRKGLWIGRSDERRETWEWDGPHFDMQEVYSCMVDTRGGRTRLLAGAASSWLGPQVAYSDDLGGTLGARPGRRDPVPGRHRRVGRAGLAAPAGDRRRRGVGGHRARRGVAVRRPRAHLHARAGPVGPPAASGVGRGLRRPGLPHAAAAPERPRVADRRDLDRRRLPDHRRRRFVVAAQPGHPGGVPPRGPAVPRVRPVRAQGGPAPVAARAAVRPEPRRRLPLRRRGRLVDLDRRRAARPTSASRSWSTRTTPTPSTSSRSRAPTAATRPRARPASGGPATPVRPGRPWAAGRARRPAGPASSSA